MKLSVVDVETVMRSRVLENIEGHLVTFDIHTMEDSSQAGKGDLTRQNDPFLHFHIEIAHSRRVGPTVIAPTRYYGDLYIGYFTKKPKYIKDAKLLERVADWFAEQTVEGIRFRTFKPYLKSKEHGFTQYLGVVNFDFELYRGA